MPHPRPLPTPVSSTEIRGKDGSSFSSLQMSFELPPPAVSGAESRPSSACTKSPSASSYHPTSPISPTIPASEVVKIRRRSSVAQAPEKDAFALPPPPSRSRKIIQMKPKSRSEEQTGTVTDGAKTTPGKGATTTPPKKKQPSSTSVAGRKIARKTAHSLIERRRRSKMNDEFGVLKDMIPACTGEMHKLAILQASIDYVRYLEDCVAKLQAENKRNNSAAATERSMPPSEARQIHASSRRDQSWEEDDDIEMSGSSRPSPATSTPLPDPRQPSASPGLLPQDARARQSSYSSISTSRNYSFATSHSSTASPALLPGSYDYARSSAAGSTLTSPALLPQCELDQEATAALLMLNTDRRGTQGSSSGRGMSVRDLLST